MLKSLGNAVLIMAGMLAGAGAVVGAIAGAAGLVIGRGPEDAAGVVSSVYWSLLLILPATLWLAHYVGVDQPEARGAYLSLPSAVLTSLVSAAVGALAGAAPFFLVTAVNIPVVLGGLDANAFSAAVQQRLFWSEFIPILAITLLCSIPLALIFNRHAMLQSF